MKKNLKTTSRHLKISVLFLAICFLFTGFILPEKEIYENAILNDGRSIVGKQLFETRCNICHGIKGKTEAMLAPPFYNIKSKYSKVFRTKASFENAIVNFVSEPKKENTMMYGAVKQFGVMPKLPYPKEELIKIAEYIYNTEFQKPVRCNNGKNKMRYNSTNMKLSK